MPSPPWWTSCLLSSSPPALYWGIKVHGKLNRGELQVRAQHSTQEFCVQYLLNCPPDTILCLYVSLISAPNISYPYANTLECAKNTPPVARTAAKVTPKKVALSIDCNLQA